MSNMETITLIVNNIPPSLNVIERMHHFKRQKAKDEWEQFVGWEAKIQKVIPKVPLQKCIVRLIYHFVDKKGRDPDNYNGKWTMDGLRKIGIIANDTFNHVDLKAIQGEPNPKNPHMEIKIAYER
jgi:crossover junction endodeoxyribonuclease RusA